MPHPNRPMKPFERTALRARALAQLAMRAAIYWARESFVLQFRHRPIRRLATKMALRQLEQQVPDRGLRERLTPRYEMGCKRILPTDEWYPALMQPNVEVITDGIREIRGRSVVSADGSEREVDTIILGHRLPRDRLPDRRIDPRARRPHAGRGVGRLGSRVQGRFGGGLSQPVLPRRPQHGAGPQLDRVHDRVAARVRGRRAAHDAPPGRSRRSRCAKGRRAPTTASWRS